MIQGGLAPARPNAYPGNMPALSRRRLNFSLITLLAGSGYGLPPGKCVTHLPALEFPLARV